MKPEFGPHIGIVPVLVLFIAATAIASGFSAEGKAWWAHVLFLAADDLQGRKAGTEGHKKAAEYVAAEFRKIGLKPAGTEDYFQPVSFRVRQIVEADSKLELIHDGVAQQLDFAREANLSPRGESGRTIEAEAVFVGHGLTVPEAGINDLAGLNLKGKIAVLLRGAPASLPGPLAAHAQSTSEQWGSLRAAGAIGIASIFNPQRADIPWARATLARLSPSLRLSAPELVETTGQQIALTFSPESADRLLAGTGHTVAELLAADKAGQPLPKFPLKVKIRSTASFTESNAVSDNVLGMLPGSDEKLKDEYIVYSAHLDHLGVGSPVPANPNDRIYNGAMDNASGIASMIEVGKALSGKKLKRSILFAAVTGEEGGLMGSKFLVSRPTLKNARVIANINTDMYLPIIPLKGITVLGLEESDLGKTFTAVSGKFGIPSKSDPEPKRNRFIRSDQYSFIRSGIPSLAFKFHADPGTPEMQVMTSWLTERYHAPSDDVSQPVDVEGAVQFDRIMAAFMEEVASAPTRPEWYGGSFFRRYVKQAP